MKKGFVFTADSVLALLISVFIILSIAFVLYSVGEAAKRDYPLSDAVWGVLTYMEKSGALSSGNSAELKNALGQLSPSICAELTVVSRSGAEVYSVNNGCKSSECGSRVASATRSFQAINSTLRNSEEFMAELKGCYK